MNIRNASVSTADPSKGERIQLTTLQVASKVVAGSPGAKLRGATGLPGEEVSTIAEHQKDAEWSVADWHGKTLVDREGEKIGKLQDVYVDVETDEPQFGTIKEGFIGRHLTFVPLGGITVGPDELRVAVSRDQVKDAPNLEIHGDELSQADESALYHHYELNYTPPNPQSGRRLARR